MRKCDPLSTDCGIEEKPVKLISEQPTEGNVKTTDSSSSTSAISPPFASLIVLSNQTIPQAANNASLKPRTILPRASNTPKKLPISPRMPVLLNPITTIALNPISTVPLLIKLEPVNAVSVGPVAVLSKEHNVDKRLINPAISKRNEDSAELSLKTDSILRDDATMHSCDYCDYRCKRKYDIKRHIVCMHMSDQLKMELKSNKLVCSICERAFQNKITLRQHVMKLHFKPEQNVSKNSIHYCFCCDICHEGFYMQKQLLAHHDVVHSDAAPITWLSFRAARRHSKVCEQCNRNYRESKFSDHSCTPQDETTLRKMKNVLNSCPAYKCDLCSLCFSWKWLYRQHRENTHPNALTVNWENIVKQAVPNYCGSCFLALDDGAVDHQCVDSEKENNFKMHTCSQCNTSYVRKADFYRHMRLKHPLDFENNEEIVVKRRTTSINCPYCKETRANKVSILDHIKAAHNMDIDTPFICVPCNKSFKRKTTLDTHNQIYHPQEQSEEEASRILKESEILLNGERAFHCSICNRNMFDSLRFMAHYRLHNIERRFTCDLCGKQTRTQHQLNSHIKFIHLNIRNYECDICRKSFHAKQSCEEHRRIHTGERPFSCEICGKTFIAMNALFTHQKFHNDFYAHSCHLCPKKFKIRRSLTNHIRTHTGERPFQCDLCSKTFNNSSRFSYHKKVTHSDKRPFTCSKCGSCFKANKFLMRHMKLHDVRTHIQFRRRNNPTYFATQKACTGGKSSDSASKKRRVELSPDSDHEKYAATVDLSNETVEELVESVFVKVKNCDEEITVDEMDFK